MIPIKQKKQPLSHPLYYQSQHHELFYVADNHSIFSPSFPVLDILFKVAWLGAEKETSLHADAATLCIHSCSLFVPLL